MAEERSWYQSPWVWGGCGCCLGAILLPFLLFGVGLGGVFWAFTNLGVQDQALDLVRSNRAVTERLGEPLDTGWLISGNVSTSGDDGEADYSIPISGPEGSGRLYIEAVKDDGVWSFRELFVRVDGDRIDIVGGEALPEAPPEDLPEEPAPELDEAPLEEPTEPEAPSEEGAEEEAEEESEPPTGESG